MQIEWVDECSSTSTLLLSRVASAPHGTVIAARAQTAGRGQRGNSWEAEPGRNLTFSLLLRPQKLVAARSFELSMIVAIAIAEVLEPLAEHPVEVKWPNDIYVNSRKICGILIENAFCGNRIERSVAGIGVNVNQEQFLSDAPNPVSLKQLTLREFPLEPLLATLCSRIINDLEAYENNPDPEALSARYHNRLWRREGKHRWLDCITGEVLEAGIASVALSGHLTLTTTPPRTYAFKEISAL